MPIRTLKNHPPPEVHTWWTELGQILRKYCAVITSGENAGCDMSHHAEMCTLMTERFTKIGLEYYPSELAAYLDTPQ